MTKLREKMEQLKESLGVEIDIDPDAFEER